jgi:hypothetical protein
MNKGQAGIIYIYGLMLGILILLLGFYLAPAISESSKNAMNESSGDFYGMDCNNESISNFQKVNCLATDLTMPYFIGFILLLSLAIIAGKVIIS